MPLDDPTVQKTIAGTVLAFFAAVGWWIKRRIGVVDDLIQRVSEMEKHKASHDTLDKRVNEVKTEIRTGHESILKQIERTHQRVDEIYRHMPKRTDNGR